MPYLNVNTNINQSESEQTELMQELSQIMSQNTGKSESYIMIEINPGKTMLFAGDDSPLAYLECKSIGLSTAQAGNLSEALCGHLTQKLAIPSNRIYIEFANCPANMFGWNGSTFG